MRGRLSWEKNELDNILEYRYEKKRNLRLKKRLIFWLTTQRHLELFSLQLSYVLFRYWITGQFFFSTSSSPVPESTYNAQLGLFLSWGIWLRAPSKHIQPLSHSTQLHSTRWCLEPLAATVREDWSRKRDSSPRRTRIPNQNNNRIKHTQQLDQSFLCFKKYLDIWWLHNHTYSKADWRDFISRDI